MEIEPVEHGIFHGDISLSYCVGFIEITGDINGIGMFNLIKASIFLVIDGGYDGDIVRIELFESGLKVTFDFPGFTREATGEIINLFGPANPKWVLSHAGCLRK